MVSNLFLSAFASIFLILGFYYLANPRRVAEINAALREFLLNDAYIGIHRRRIGSFLVLIGVVILAVAWLDR